jgi:DNA-binding response OmpR family regulator
MNTLYPSTSFRLLVVDDEETARTSLCEILRLEGYQVESASDGSTAISKITQQAALGFPYDLILLDLKMPRIDGLEVLRFITKQTPDATDPNRPLVILLTAHGSLESAIEALRHGAHDYLLKPSSPEQIIKSVSRALEVKSERKQKSSLINDLEVSIQKLKTIVEPAYTSTNQKDTIAKDKMQNERGKEKVYHLENGINIDLARREVFMRSSGNVKRLFKLTPTEGKLMGVFLDHPHRVYSHRELVAQVQGYETKDWEAAEVLRPLVSRLRRKLSQIPGGENWILSIRGTGYVFDLEVE